MKERVRRFRVTGLVGRTGSGGAGGERRGGAADGDIERDLLSSERAEC